MKLLKCEILKADFGRAKLVFVVERSTDTNEVPVKVYSEPTDIMLYRQASALAELKKIAGYSDVCVKSEYKFLLEEARQDSQDFQPC